jgi:hypothetical protein
MSAMIFPQSACNGMVCVFYRVFHVVIMLLFIIFSEHVCYLNDLVINPGISFKCGKCTDEEHRHVFGRVVVCSKPGCPEVNVSETSTLASMVLFNIPVHVGSCQVLIEAVATIYPESVSVLQTLFALKGGKIASTLEINKNGVVADVSGFFRLVSSFPILDDSFGVAQRIDLRLLLFGPLQTVSSVYDFVDSKLYLAALNEILNDEDEGLESWAFDILYVAFEYLTSTATPDMFGSETLIEHPAITGLKRRYPEQMKSSSAKQIKKVLRGIDQDKSTMILFALHLGRSEESTVAAIMKEASQKVTSSLSFPPLLSLSFSPLLLFLPAARIFFCKIRNHSMRIVLDSTLLCI